MKRSIYRLFVLALMIFFCLASMQYAISAGNEKVFLLSSRVSVYDIANKSLVSYNSPINDFQPISFYPPSIVATEKYVYIQGSDYKSYSDNKNVIGVFGVSDNLLVTKLRVCAYQRVCGLAINPVGTYVYVTNPYDSTISLISTSDNTIVTTLTHIKGVWGTFAFGQDGSYAYLPIQDQVDAFFYVAVIRTSDHAVVAKIKVGTKSQRRIKSIYISPDGTLGYVTSVDENIVTVFNTKTNQVIATIPVPTPSLSPGNDIAFNSAGTVAYILSSYVNKDLSGQGGTGVLGYSSLTPEQLVAVTVLDTKTHTIKSNITGFLPSSMAISPDRSLLYLAVRDKLSNGALVEGTADIIAYDLNSNQITSNKISTFSRNFSKLFFNSTGTHLFALGQSVFPGKSGSIAIDTTTNTFNYLTTGNDDYLNGIVVTANSVSPKITLKSSQNPSIKGSPVTFTVTGTDGQSLPVGGVTFKDGDTYLGQSSASGDSASITVSSLDVGSHAITVQSNAMEFNIVTASLTQIVNPDITTGATTGNAHISGAPTGTFQGEGQFGFFSVQMSTTKTDTIFGTQLLNSGTFKNSDNGVTGQFQTTGFTLDGVPLLFYTWEGKCPGGFFLTMQQQTVNTSKLDTNVMSALDCNGEAGKLAFSMNRTSSDAGMVDAISPASISLVKPVMDKISASDTVTGRFVGDGEYKFFSITMNSSSTKTALNTLDLPFGTFLNSNNNVTGSFSTTGFTINGTPMQFFSWKSSCSGGLFITIEPQSANKLGVTVLDALDCLGRVQKQTFTMTKQ